MVLVKTCCCGCTLGQGTFGIAIWSTMESALLVIGGALLVDAVDDPTDPKLKEELTESVRKTLKALLICYIVEGSIIFAASLILFLAVKMKKRKLLLPWLIARGILLVLTVVLMMIIWLVGKRGSIAGLNIVGCLLLAYFYVVVLSYYQSDMGRTLTRGGIILVPPPQTGLLPNTQPLYNSHPGGPLPPLAPNAYPIIQPVYPGQQGMPANVLPLNPVKLQDSTKTGDQPPPYNANP